MKEDKLILLQILHFQVVLLHSPSFLMTMNNLLFLNLVVATAISAAAINNYSCKSTPLDSSWPNPEQWANLNASLHGTLIQTLPVASSCYAGNPFGSEVSCDLTSAQWSLPDFHIALPESVQYPYYANNSCLPPGAQGYNVSRGCTLGGLPQYIVNASTPEHVATAMTWASTHNIRIVVKGTGHDMNGR